MAPVRTADVGGWTDTWFARTGTVCNIALAQHATVRIRAWHPDAGGGGATRRRRAPSGGVRLVVAMSGEVYEFEPLDASALPGRHPMLEAAVAALPPPTPVTVEVGDDVVLGGGLGGSAAVLVALVAALSTLRDEGRGPLDLARLAHRCEVGAGREAGVQDHIAAAFGGISAIEVAYPDAARAEVLPDPSTRSALQRRLLTVSFGRAHSSSDVHREVIGRLSSPGGSATLVALDRIRAAGRAAIDSLRDDDLEGYGRALAENQEALRSMHPGTISNDAEELGRLAAAHGAAGWKVNGAGGAGGSMAVLASADPQRRRAFADAVAARAPWRVLDVSFDDDGVRTRLVDATTSPPAGEAGT